LIQKYGGLDEIYAHIDTLSPDLRGLLETNKDLVYRSRDLVQLHTVQQVDHSLKSFVFEFQPELWKEVLVKRHRFASLEKAIDDLKRTLVMPVQNSLFG